MKNSFLQLTNNNSTERRKKSFLLVGFGTCPPSGALSWDDDNDDYIPTEEIDWDGDE